MFNAFKKLLNTTVNTDEEETRERLELGITPELLQLVDNISKYPESFKDFPFHTLKDGSIKMTKLQKRHVEKILEIVKPLNDLRYQICPSYMDDEKFWRIYFTHIKSVTKGIFEPPGSSTASSKSNDFLDELDSQFDKLSSTQKKMVLDEGISEEEDSYFSENKYRLQFTNKDSATLNNNNTSTKQNNTSPTTTLPTPTITTSTTITSPIIPSTQINSNKNINNDNTLIDTSFDDTNNNNNNNNNDNHNNDNNNILNNSNNNNIDNIFNNTLSPS